MTEEEFILKMVSRILLFLGVCGVLVAAGCEHRVSKIAHLIENGGDPMAVRCAIEGVGIETAAICARVGEN